MKIKRRGFVVSTFPEVAFSSWNQLGVFFLKLIRRFEHWKRRTNKRRAGRRRLSNGSRPNRSSVVAGGSHFDIVGRWSGPQRNFFFPPAGGSGGGGGGGTRPPPPSDHTATPASQRRWTPVVSSAPWNRSSVSSPPPPPLSLPPTPASSLVRRRHRRRELFGRRGGVESKEFVCFFLQI